MSAADQTTAERSGRRTASRRGRQRVALQPPNLGRTLRSEWVKFWTLPSSIWIIAITIVVMVGLSALMAWGLSLGGESGAPQDPSAGGGADVSVQPGEGAQLPALGLVAVTFSYSVGQIVLAVLGVLVATSEYATGQIRATLTAVPTRTPVLVAKVILVALVALGLGALAVGLSWLATYPILQPEGLHLDPAVEGTWRTLAGVPLYLAAIALFSLGVGFLLRHTAGAIAAVLGVLLVLPILTMIPIDWVQDLALYLPASAGERLVLGAPDDTLSEWQGYAVLCAYAVAALAAAAVLLRRRDA